MSVEQDPKRQALSVRPTTGDYDVGYGKPPAKTRFKISQSGNPKGRPKGSSNKPKPPALNEERMKSILIQEAYRTIRSMRALARSARRWRRQLSARSRSTPSKGTRGHSGCSELLTTTERGNRRLHDQWLDTAITYKVEWERELTRRERLGITGLEPLPHPDHVVVNIRTGEVAIRGPATKEEKARHDMILQAKVEFQAELDELDQLLKDEPDYPYRAQVEADIAHNRKLLDMIRKGIPD